ncbi:tyrosine-type recombinase/integrase [Celerinatantimonas sp. MCCC 1A17872]|uniref:tyrosine-type recombinase/integrase n=1 Tax=Celerinatantimonas sp. MCCC 1A17872 TaxID=3177514 RepID=UPI0038C7BFED
MAQIYKRGKKWRAQVRLKHQSRSGTFDSKIEAMAWAVEIEQELGKDDGIISGKTLGDAFARYAKEVSPSKKGYRWEIVRLNKLMRAPMADIALKELRVDDIQRWITHELTRVQASSVNRELNVIAVVLETARKRWKWIATNPSRDVERPRNPRPRDRRISELEIQRILDALEFNDGEAVKTQRQEIAVGFLLALETAMRQGEIWGLNWVDVHLRQRYITLNETKNGTSRNVPLSSRAVELLKMLKEQKDGVVFHHPQRSCGVLFRRALKIAGIRNMTFHDTRHEALTRLARKLDVLDLARMVGHRDPRSLMIYYNATATEIAERLG